MMNAILRHSPVGVMLEDSMGSIVYANPEVEAIYHLQASDMPGKKLSDVYSAAGAVRSDEDQADGTLELRMGDPVRIVHVRRVVIPGLEGEPAGILTLHEDVTAQRLALEAKDLMLRAIGHEVRSPAAAMKNTLAGIMQWDTTIDAKGRRELLQEAYESSDRLLSLVESQLIIAKLETRHFEPTPEPVDLPSVLEGVMGVIRHRYAERALAVEIDLRDGLPLAYCEPAHVAQVLTNLISNALEYTSGAVSVQARAASRGWLEVTVADRGPGLPAGSLEGLFEKTGPAGRNRSRVAWASVYISAGSSSSAASAAGSGWLRAIAAALRSGSPFPPCRCRRARLAQANPSLPVGSGSTQRGRRTAPIINRAPVGKGWRGDGIHPRSRASRTR